MDRFGLTDEETKEYEAFTEKWRRSTFKEGPLLTDEEEARYAELDKRTEYQFWPCEEEAPEATKMIDTGFFVDNPAHYGDARPASMYFDPDEAEAYMESHPGSKLWTLVEGEDDTQWIEQGSHLVNRLEYLIEDPEWAKRMQTVDKAAGILGTHSLGWLEAFLVYLDANHEGDLLPWLQLGREEVEAV